MFCVCHSSGSAAQNTLNCFYFTSQDTHVPATAYWWVRADGEEKKLWVALSTFSPVVIFSVSTWLIQRHVSEREYNRALWSFIFLEMLVSSFCVQASSNSNGRHGRSGLCPHFPSEEPFDLVLALGLAEFPCSVAPLEAVPAGHLECWIRSPCISAVISHVQLFVTP